MGKRIEVNAGDRYGRLTVVREQPSVNWRRVVTCKCDCGVKQNVLLSSLRSGTSKSCGCLRREVSRKNGKRFGPLNRRHGMTKTPTYSSWAMMKQRCCNRNDVEYVNYGERGIVVCDTWRDSFEAFLADMGERPTPQHSIERIDNNGNYNPGNCRWATPKQQARNRSNNVMLTFRGETMCISAWAEKIGIPRKTLGKRINHYGYTVEEALTLPLRARRTP